MISKAPVLTDTGMSLLIRGMTGETLMFTRFALGSGDNGSADPSKRTSLLVPEMDVPLTIRDADADGYINLFGSFDNAGIRNPFTWRELGVYCAGEKHQEFTGGSASYTLTDKPGAVYRVLVNGSPVTISGYNAGTGAVTLTAATAAGAKVEAYYPDPVDRLYAYVCDSENGVQLAAGSSSVVVEQGISLMVAVGTTEHVTAMLTASQLYAGKEEFDAHANSRSNPHAVTKEQIGLGNVVNLAPPNMKPGMQIPQALTEMENSETLAQMMGKMQLTIRTVTSHLAAENPHGITPAKIGAAKATHTHTPGDITNAIPITKGGTGAKTAAEALRSLGIVFSETEPAVIEGGIWLKPIE